MEGKGYFRNFIIEGKALEVIILLRGKSDFDKEQNTLKNKITLRWEKMKARKIFGGKQIMWKKLFTAEVF